MRVWLLTGITLTGMSSFFSMNAVSGSHSILSSTVQSGAFFVMGTLSWRFKPKYVCIFATSCSILSNVMSLCADVYVNTTLLFASFSMGNFIIIQIWMYDIFTPDLAGIWSGAITGLANASFVLPHLVVTFTSTARTRAFVHGLGLTLGILGVAFVIVHKRANDVKEQLHMSSMWLHMLYDLLNIKLACLCIVYAGSFSVFTQSLSVATTISESNTSFLILLFFSISTARFVGSIGHVLLKRHLFVLPILNLNVFILEHIANPLSGTVTGRENMQLAVLSMHILTSSFMNGMIFHHIFDSKLNILKIALVASSPRFFSCFVNTTEAFYLLKYLSLLSAILSCFISYFAPKETLSMFITREESLTLVQKLMNGLAHDMQTPIARITMLLDKLSASYRGPTSTLNEIAASVNELSEYRNRCMQMFKYNFDTNNWDTSKLEMLSLPDLLDHIVFRMSVIFKDKKVCCTYSDVHVCIFTDVVWMKDVLLNLLHNALCHGEGDVQVSVVYAQDCHITVRNVFASTNETSSTSTSSQGSPHGIGLTHTELIVRRCLNGKFWTVRKDNVFVAHVTFRPRISRVENTVSKALLNDVSAFVIVEDDPLLLELTVGLLRRYAPRMQLHAFHDIHGFESWMTARTNVSGQTVVLIDFQINGIVDAGIALAQRLDKTLYHVYGLTSNDNLIHEALSVGVIKVFSKPFTLDMLREIGVPMSPISVMGKNVSQNGHNDTDSDTESDTNTTLDVVSHVQGSLHTILRTIDETMHSFKKQLHEIKGLMCYFFPQWIDLIQNTDDHLSSALDVSSKSLRTITLNK